MDLDVLTPAAGWSLSAANPTPAQIEAITEGSPILLQVGGADVLVGWIDQKRLSSSRSGTILSLSGRDHVAPLVDCSVPMTWSLKNITLYLLATQILAHLGIPAIVFGPNDIDEPIPRVHPEPGESFWDLLVRYARERRLLVWAQPGQLHISRPNYVTPPVGALCRRVPGPLAAANNVLSADHTWKVSQRRSPVTVVGQGAGGDALFGAAAGRVVGTATDPVLTALGLARPLVVQEGTIRTNARALARARWEVEKRAGDGWIGSYTIPGHGPTSASIWGLDEIVTVLDEVAGISGPRWVAAVRFTRSRSSGTTTTLTLRDLHALLPPV